MKLKEKHGDKVETMAINLDHSGDGKPDAEMVAKMGRFVSRREIDCAHFVSEDADTKVFKNFGAEGLPLVLVYDVDGKLKKKFEGDIDYEADVVKLVDKLVESKN